MPILQMEVLTVEAAVEGAAGLHAAVPAHLDDIQVTLLMDKLRKKMLNSKHLIKFYTAFH